MYISAFLYYRYRLKYIKDKKINVSEPSNILLISIGKKRKYFSDMI